MKKATYLLSFLVLGVLFAKAQTTSGTSQISITKLIAYENNSRFYIDWATDGGNKTNYWEVQSSSDGRAFSTIALVLGPDPSKTGQQFGYKGKTTTQKQAGYYRVVHISTSGEKQQSNIIKPAKLDSMSLINPDIKNKIPVLL